MKNWKPLNFFGRVMVSMLKTKHLILNHFAISDASLVASMAGDVRVVEMTASIPYPYEESMAISWINDHTRQEVEDHNFVFAIRTQSTNQLVGCINLGLNFKHDSGVVGYWIGHDYWGKGYATEALAKIVEFGFEKKSLHKIWAEHKTFNVPSGRVMEKVGMIHEGIKRSHFKQGEDQYVDMSIKSILRQEYEARLSSGT